MKNFSRLEPTWAISLGINSEAGEREAIVATVVGNDKP